MSKLSGVIPLEDAQDVAEEVLTIIDGKALVCGSIRRELDFVGDVDIVAIYSPELSFKLQKMGFVAKNSVAEAVIRDIPVSVYFSMEETWGSMTLHYTGSKELNIIMRALAKKKGLILNQYGLFEDNSVCVASKTEEEIFDRLNYKYLDPKNRNKKLKGSD